MLQATTRVCLRHRLCCWGVHTGCRGIYQLLFIIHQDLSASIIYQSLSIIYQDLPVSIIYWDLSASISIINQDPSGSIYSQSGSISISVCTVYRYLLSVALNTAGCHQTFQFQLLLCFPFNVLLLGLSYYYYNLPILPIMLYLFNYYTIYNIQLLAFRLLLLFVSIIEDKWKSLLLFFLIL